MIVRNSLLGADIADSDLVSHVCTEESSQVSLNLYLHSKVASFLSLQSLGRLFESSIPRESGLGAASQNVDLVLVR